MTIARFLLFCFIALASHLSAASLILVVDENDSPIPFKQITVTDSVPFGGIGNPVTYITDAQGEVQHTSGPAHCYLLIKVEDCTGTWQTFVTDNHYPRGTDWWSSASPVRVCRQSKPATIAIDFYWRKSISGWWPATPVFKTFWLKHYKLNGTTHQPVGSYTFTNRSTLDTSFVHQDRGRLILETVDCTGDTIATVWDYDYNQSRIYQSRVWVCDTAPTTNLLIFLDMLAIGAHNYAPIVVKDSSFTNSTIQFDTLNTDFYTASGDDFVIVLDSIPHPGNSQLTFYAHTQGGFLPIYEATINQSIPRLTDSLVSFCPVYSFAVSEFALKPKAMVLPNPFNESIKINLAEDQRNTRINLYGMQGNMLLSHYTTNELEIKLETESFPVGMYLIEITSEAGTEIHKAVKR